MSVTYPTPPDHDPRFQVIDGRHRFAAAVLRGAPSELRCDVITPSGHALRVIPLRHLQIHSGVQLDFAYKERWALHIANHWDDRLVGVLTVTTDNGGGLTREEAATVKLGIDRDRRAVTPMESFHEEVIKGDQDALAILRAAEDNGWEIGKLGGSSPPNRIGSIAVLWRIFGDLGQDGLRRTLALASHWRNDRGGSAAEWISAFGLLVRDGYDELVTPEVWERWRDLVPTVELRRARGESAAARSGHSRRVGEVAYIIAGRLRKVGRLRRRPPPEGSGRGSRPRPIP